jgi:hypothetical protein
VALTMARLAGFPGAGVHWADVVAYLDRLKAKNLLTADDQKWLEIYRQRAAGEAGK